MTSRGSVLWDVGLSVGVVLFWLLSWPTYFLPFAVVLGVVALVVRGRSVLRPLVITAGVFFALVCGAG